MTVKPTHYRTVWVSDVHLGTRGCQADKLLSFLKQTETDNLILLGDIIDLWAISRKPYWPPEHDEIIQNALARAETGTNVMFIPGNHDEDIRRYSGISFGGVKVVKKHIHTLADGRQILCVHGDDYDVITKYHKWLAVAGDIAYTMLLYINRKYNAIRRRLGMRYWSLSGYIKHKVKNAVSFISDYENNVVKHVKSTGVDGVICGHIHRAEISYFGKFLYLNTGDWVESCTAIVEHDDGTLELIQWTERE